MKVVEVFGGPLDGRTFNVPDEVDTVTFMVDDQLSPDSVARYVDIDRTAAADNAEVAEVTFDIRRRSDGKTLIIWEDGR